MNTEELLDALLDKGAFFIVFTDARIEKVKDGQGVSISLTVPEYAAAIIEGKERELLRRKCLEYMKSSEIRSVAEEYHEDPHIMSLLIGKTPK